MFGGGFLGGGTLSGAPYGALTGLGTTQPAAQPAAQPLTQMASAQQFAPQVSTAGQMAPYPSYSGMPTTGGYPTAPQYPNLPAEGQGAANPNAPAYGLAGANQALSGSWGGGTMKVNPDYSHINDNRDMGIGYAQQGVDGMQGFVDPGVQAQQHQAALSGALGSDAQAQAYANFQSSPGQQWLVDQAERGLTRNAAATGGLGGANVLKALQENAVGLASQDYQNQFANLGTVADRGMTGAQTQAGLYDSMGNMASAAGGQGAGLQSAAMGAQASMANANTAANSALAQAAAGYAYDAGQGIANNYDATTSALAGLANQQGTTMAGQYGGNNSNIAGLINNAGMGQSNSLQGQAGLLSNTGLGYGGYYAGLPSLGGTQPNNAMGGAGDMLTGVGNFGTMMGWSDARLKTNIRKVGMTRGGNSLYSWDWNEEGLRIAGGQPTTGVIAQEVNQDAVVVGDDGYLMVDYSRVI